MVRMHGADTYSKWITGELRFNTPEVKAAFQKFEEILFGEGFVLGGAENVAATNFRDTPLPMFNDPPSCMMMKQGSFISSYFPVEGVASTFPFPTIDGGSGALGGGDYLMVFENDPQAIQLVKDIITPEWMCAHASATGGTASPIGGHGVEGVTFLPGHADTDPNCYTGAEAIAIATAITDALAADTFVFDGGDAMPAEVGSGTFWVGMIDHSRGKDLDTVLSEIDEGWPE
jgi:alpha-glucoside transport system substrate-binding protein